MEQYVVTGMSCAACSTRVEKAVSKVEGVTACSVSLLTNSMGVEGTAKPEDIMAAVDKAGYKAFKKDKSGSKEKKTEGQGVIDHSAEEAILEDRETPLLKKRLIASIGFLIILMYISMGHMMWGFPLPSFLDGNHVAMGLSQMLLAIIVMIINQKFFKSGFTSLIHGAPNMDTLVAMGSAASFIYSTCVLYAMTAAQSVGDTDKVMYYMHEFYFESAAMILTLITVGKMLEARSKGKTTDALKGLMKLAPKSAVVIRDGGEVEVPIEDVLIGDIFVVRPGENIPVDGIVTEGYSAVNEAALTGESIPVDKKEGDKVSAGTVNQSGFIKCRASRVGEDTTLSQIIRMVADAAATKAPIAKVADKVSGIFVPTVISIAVITTVVWLILGKETGFALARGISVLVISCPCALGLATPVAIMVGNGVGARHGILYKTAASIEAAGRVKLVALDKTGTITKGEPKVTDVIPADGINETELVGLAYSLERRSEHPLAKAVVEYGNAVFGLNGAEDEITDFKVVPGNGLCGKLKSEQIYGGNENYIKEILGTEKPLSGKLSEKMTDNIHQLSKHGKTSLLFAKDNTFMGIIAVADVIKEDSRKAIENLKEMGIKVVMITGDNEESAKTIGELSGVDEVIAGVLPDGKESKVKELMEQGKTAMVGDGINDAPALTRADVGIAIGAGTDIAIDAADVVLMKSSLMDVVDAITLGRATLKNIHENLFWAFIYNVIGIPLAAGVWIPIFGWQLNPMFGALAMSLSSFCVVTNALRLNLVKLKNVPENNGEESDKSEIGNAKKLTDYNMACGKTDNNATANNSNNVNNSDNNNNDQIKEDYVMEKTMTIEGMMCGHCEANVKKALEAIDGVTEAVVSHEKGTAVVKLSSEVDNEVLKKAVEDKDYAVVSVE